MDTNDFLLKLQQLDDLSSESLWVTLDVIFLYTNIPHQEGLDACREILKNQGTAMGTRMAPSYANIFTGKLERDLLQQTRQKPTIWWRYIDDIFAFWPHGEESLQVFLTELNSFHPMIKFTAK